MICQHSPDPSTSRHLSDGWRSVSGCSPAESCHGARPGAGLRALAPFLSLSSRGRGLKEPLSRGHPVPVAVGASLSKNRLGDVCAVLLPLHIPSVAHKSWWEGAGSGRLCRPSALPHCMWGGHCSGSLVQAGCCLGLHLMASSSSSSHSCWNHICHGRCNLFHTGSFQQTLRTGLESHPCSPLIIES